MSNILLVNDNVQDYQTIINACRNDTYAITYNEKSDTYDSIFAKYENIVIENNIQIVNYLGLVAHGNNNPEFVFLEKENKMLISQYLFHNTNGLHKCIIDLSLNLTQEEFDTKETYTHKDILYIFKDISGNLLREFYNILDSDKTYQKLDVSNFIEKIYYTITYKIPENEYVLNDSSMKTMCEYFLNREMHRYILNNLDTWKEFKEFIKKFNIKHCLDFLGCALLQSSDWIYTLDMLETEQHLYLNIRASDDDTGNLKVGGDWVLESDNVNIKELYFNVESIEKWYRTLAAAHGGGGGVSLLRNITNGYANVERTEVDVPYNNIKFSELYDSFYTNPDANDSIKLSANLNETKLFDLNWKRDGSKGTDHDEGNELSIGEKFRGKQFVPSTIPVVSVSPGAYSPPADTIPGFQGYNPGPINA